MLQQLAAFFFRGGCHGRPDSANTFIGIVFEPWTGAIRGAEAVKMSAAEARAQ